MKNSLLILLLLVGLSCQVFGQTPAKDFEGSWHGTLEAGGQKLRLALTVTKSDAGAYAAKLDSLDQGATIPIDTITVNGDAVRLEVKSPAIVFEGTLNKERTELTGTFTQGNQPFPLSFKRSEQAAVVPPTAKDFEGSWQGTLEAGAQKLRLLVTVTKSAGVYAGKFDSLDQAATIPIDAITVNGDAVRWEIKSAAILYEGTLNKERTELTGTFTQADQKFPLTLKRGDQAAVTPTATPTPTPKRDYSAPPDAPYTAEEVVVKTTAGHTLAGTLTLPKGASRTKPVGAIVTVTGSGPQDRDENIESIVPGFRPFRQLADALARRGIAVLRMDDRGTGASGGTFKGSTSADFAEDVRAGLAYLRTRPEIRADRLGVLGHSEGAIIAPMVAEKEPTLRAIVLLAGIAQPGRTALHFQLKNGIEHNTKLTPEMRDSQIAEIPKRIDGMMADPWMKFFLTYDPAPTMRRVKTPVLILTGSRDQQAVPEQVALQEAAFKEGGNKDVTARVLPDVNHLFVQDTDGFPANYTKLPPPVMMRTDVVEMIVDWLSQRLK